MDFKSLLLSCSLVCLLSACTDYKPNVDDKDNEGKIGVPVQNMSSLQTPYGAENSQVFLVDKTTRKIHQFNLNTMEHIRKFEIDSPEDDHYVLHQDPWEYIIDLSAKNFSILRYNGERVKNPLSQLGTPESYAYDSTNGYLVVYDSVKTMGILKLSKTGEVLKQVQSGSYLEDKYSVKCGDVTNAGKLILAVKNNQDDKYSLAVIDLDSTVKNYEKGIKAFSVVYYPVNLEEIVWLSPNPKNLDQVIIKSKSKVSLYNFSTATLSSIDIGDWIVEKYSKVQDPHLIAAPKEVINTYYYRTNYEGKRKLIYIGTAGLKVVEFERNSNLISSSHLYVDKDEWRIVSHNSNKYYYENDYNKVKNSRRLQKARLSDLMTTDDLKIDDTAQINITNDYIFSLYPTKLGYVRRTHIRTNEVKENKLFNLQDL